MHDKIDTTAQRRRITNRAQVRQFVLAGKSRFTLVSTKTGARFTFRVTASENPGRVTHFVSLLTGSDNESAYTYIGTVYSSGEFGHGRKSPIAATAASVMALRWFWTVVMEERAENTATTIPATVEFWHEGRCCRCGRALTVPASIERGIGPECAGRMGVTLSNEQRQIDADELAMQRMEVEADRAGTIRDELNKWANRNAMERVS